jgi:hypothetical protein
MKKAASIIVICLYCFTSHAQQRPVSVEEAFKGLNHCVDIEVAAMRIVPEFYAKNQLDSIALTLDYLKTVCQETEALRITRFLLEMEQRTFSDSSISSRDIYLIKKEAKHIANGHLYDFGYFLMAMNYAGSSFAKNPGNPFMRADIEKRMIEMIRTWRRVLLLRGGLTELELSILHHLRTEKEDSLIGKNLFHVINKPQYRGTRIRKQYDHYHSNYMLSNSFHLQLSYSHWLSTGAAASLFRSKPGMYFSLGYLFSNYNRIDAYMGARFGEARVPYRIIRPDTSFFGKKGDIIVMGFDYTRTLWRPSRLFDLGVSAGLGLQQRRFFNRLPQSDDIVNETNDIINAKMGKYYNYSGIYSAGIEFKYFIHPGLAINFSPRYLFSGNIGNTIGNSSINGNMLMINLGLSLFSGGHPGRNNTSFWNLTNDN